MEIETSGQADAPDAPGLRERRRRETLAAISDAALDLFELRGAAATTVDGIAQAAGVSQRTFFRYFPTKEHAAFIDDAQVEQAMNDAIEAIRSGTPIVPAFERSWMRVYRAFAGDEAARARFRRVRRLVHDDPALLAVALRRDAEHEARLTDAAVEASGAGADPLTTRALIAVLGTIARLAFDEWARRDERDDHADVRELYLSLRRGLGQYAGELSTAPGGTEGES
ncbi:TetR family transcriptional regulator [Agromyces sp. G08B096]|uniref:TetR family transcriptional regulator n=1 Tax=Agromyces sp. G08B096 TaxID=3156399 RepID=A0AAU7W6Q7_9MICO